MSTKISQLRRIVFRRYNGTDFDTFTLEPDDLGQDSVMTFNIAPRKMTRDSSIGSTETPISGTYDAFASSITFLADTWSIIGKALNIWNPATFQNATAANGNIIGSASANPCAGNEYCSVIAQGICDDGSSADVEFPRCIPSIDDDIEIGSSSTAEITLNLNPVVYNPNLHSDDGYPEYDYRLGDNSLTAKQKLNATTGEYEPVAEG